jgi:hypothetical protein
MLRYICEDGNEFWVHQRKNVSSQAEGLLASEEGLFSVEFVRSACRFWRFILKQK